MPPAHEAHRSEVLFIGGRAGTGKSSVASALHVLLAANGIAHAVIEGDNLDLAYPPPREHGLAEKNLHTIWANYRALGYRRLIYTNVMCVLETDNLAAAMGDDPAVTAVLLDVSHEVMQERLSRRESPRSLVEHLARTMERRADLQREAPAWVARIATDEKSLDELALELARLAGWLGAPHITDLMIRRATNSSRITGALRPITPGDNHESPFA